MASLKGKVALVTGAGRGLGRACAQIFAREGAKVIVATRTADNGEETVRLIRDAGGEAIFVRTDVAQSADVQRMVSTAVEKFGGLDCAVNNAMQSLGPVPLADIDDEDWNRALSVNFSGVFLCMKYEVRAMLQRGGGAIVNVGSGNEHTALPGFSWYLAAKQGTYGMTKVSAQDYGRQGIRVNAVAPGAGLMARAAAGPGSAGSPSLPEWAPEPVLGELPGQVRERPEELAPAYVFFASSADSGFITGQVLAELGSVTR